MRSRKGPAQKLVDRDAQRLALQVPERQIDARERCREQPASAAVVVVVHAYPVELMVQRVLAGQVAIDPAVEKLLDEPVVPEHRRLAVAFHSLVSSQAY